MASSKSWFRSSREILTEEVECDKEEGVGVSRCLVLENSPFVQTHGFLTVIKPALVVDNYKCTLPTPAGRPRRTRLKESARARRGYSWKAKLDLCLPYFRTTLENLWIPQHHKLVYS